jgi:dolichyl-phosphate beta-glucosyltransferase
MQVDRFLQTTRGEWEVLFVCDGCTDGTPQRLAELVGKHPRARILEYAPNRGKGHAVRQGLQAARGQWRLFSDVDLAYDLEDIVRLGETLRAGAEVAIASRTHPDSRVQMPPDLQGYAFKRHLQSVAFSMLVRSLLPLRQRDTQAGLKGMSGRAAQTLLPHLRCNGFGFDCELLMACARLGIEVVEVPVCVRYDNRTSTTALRHMARMIAELWRIRRAWKQSRCVDAEDTTPPVERKAA